MLVVVFAAAAMLVPALPARAISRLDLESRITKLQASLDALASSLSDAESVLDFADRAVARHSFALATASRKLDALNGAYSRRTIQMYMVGQTGVTETLATAESLDIFAERLGYLERIRSSEEGSFESLVALRRRAKVETTELGEARERAQSALRILTDRRRSLDSKLHEFQALLSLANLSGRLSSRASRGRLAGFHCPVAGPHADANNFGERRPSGRHTGDDLPADSGTPVVAVLASRVVDVVRGGWMGRGIIIRDGGGTEWWYAHLSAEYVSPGESLAAGEVIGRVGCSGHCTGPHLHFEYHPGGGEPRNPHPIVRAGC